MPPLYKSYPAIVATFEDRYGLPARTAARSDPFEQIVAVVLAQSCDERTVHQGMSGLREAGLLEAGVLAKASALEIAEAARQSGSRLPALAVQALQRLAHWIVEQHQGSADDLEELATARLREELASVKGLGPVMIDAILLFAMQRPVYPVDRASYRVLVRHGWIDSGASYEEAREALERLSPDEPYDLARLSAWMERVGRDACRPTVAKCQSCPLQPFLPPDGPRDPV